MVERRTNYAHGSRPRESKRVPSPEPGRDGLEFGDASVHHAEVGQLTPSVVRGSRRLSKPVRTAPLNWHIAA